MRFCVAILASLLVHVALAVAICAYLRFAPETSVHVELDLSSVDLSLAEKDDMAESVAPEPPTVSNPPAPHPPEMPPPEALSENPHAPPPEPLSPRPPEAEAETRAMESEAAPVPAPRQAKIDAPPRPLKAIRPDYPRASRQRGEQGDVILEIRVNAAGGVETVKVLSSSGYADLDAAAVRAVKDARFSPAQSDGSAVGATARLTLTFRLR